MNFYMDNFVIIVSSLAVLLLLRRTLLRVVGKYKVYRFRNERLEFFGPYSILGIPITIKLENIYAVRIIRWKGLLKVKGIFYTLPLFLTKRFVVIEKHNGATSSLVVGSNQPEELVEEIRREVYRATGRKCEYEL